MMYVDFMSHFSHRCRFNFAVLFLVLTIGATVASAADSKPLTNADVIKMLESRLPESVIVAKIREGKTQFDTSTDAIIGLNNKGVGEKILNAMLAPQANTGEGAKDQALPQTESPSSPTPAPAGDKPSALSYGTATGLVKKNVTTQREIIDLFGGPDVMTTDKDGTEVWMYDKKTTMVSSTGSSSAIRQETSEASQMAAFLGIPLVAGLSGSREKSKTDTAGSSQHAGEVRSSSKTITFIIKFHENKTVKDFAVRQSNY